MGQNSIDICYDCLLALRDKYSLGRDIPTHNYWSDESYKPEALTSLSEGDVPLGIIANTGFRVDHRCEGCGSRLGGDRWTLVFDDPRSDMFAEPKPNELEFDCPFAVTEGRQLVHTSLVDNVWAPDVYWDTESENAEEEMIEQLASYAWSPIRGYSGQYLSGDSPVMHASEQLGGALLERVKSEPGVYVLVVAECDPTDDDPYPEPAGWMVLSQDNWSE